MISEPYFSFYMENGFLFWTEIGIILITIVLIFKNRPSGLEN